MNVSNRPYSEERHDGLAFRSEDAVSPKENPFDAIYSYVS